MNTMIVIALFCSIHSHNVVSCLLAFTLHLIRFIITCIEQQQVFVNESEVFNKFLQFLTILGGKTWHGTLTITKEMYLIVLKLCIQNTIIFVNILLFSCTLWQHLLAAYFWYRETLDISTDVESPENINWTIGICLVSSWLLVYLAMVKGITESPKVVYVGTNISCRHHYKYFFIR